MTPFCPRYAHDPDGNLTDDWRWRYTWDAENRLIQMDTQPAAIAAGVPNQRIVYRYDAQGRRIRQTVTQNPGTATYAMTTDLRYLYDGWNLLAELDATGSVVRRHTWGTDLSGSLQGAGGVGGLLATEIGGIVCLPAYDGNGNVLSLINAADGTLAADYEYDPFGNTLKAVGPLARANPWRFSTKYTDNATGLVYYGFRYYNPSTGRWPSRDPIEEQGGVNLYGMVGNNPVNAYDLLGLWEGPDRKGASWATVVAQEGDTVAALAKMIALDESEAGKWLMNADTGRPWSNIKDAEKAGCRSKVPNTFVLYTAAATKWKDRRFWSAFELGRKFARASAQGFERDGYKIIRRENQSDKPGFISLWKEDGIAGIAFTGHGIAGTPLFFADPSDSNNGQVGPYDVSPPYRLSAVIALFCQSAGDALPGLKGQATIPRFWKNQASRNGTFVGYNIAVNTLDLTINSLFTSPWEIGHGE